MTNASHEDNPQKIVPKPRLAERKVDMAMSDDRPAKTTIRNLWIEQAKSFHDRHADEPFPIYLTLSGAEAKDIKALIDRNIIKVTESGAIAESDLHKVVAIEANSPAVLNLQKQLPGLQIITQNFGSIIKGENPLVFPDSKDHKRFCCASIVNLDLNASLSFYKNGNQIIFPVLKWIEKISLLHAYDRPGIEWCLCLTLNATLNEPAEIAEHIQRFLKENYLASPEFETSCLRLLGDRIQQSIMAADTLDFESLDMEERQKLLMIFVPKQISRLVNGHGWKVSTLKNLAYGGTDYHAPMVTWILYFTHDGRAAAMPQTVYQESLAAILTSAGKIEEDGNINEY